MKFKRKISPNTKPLSNFITKKRLKEDEINFTKLRAYRLDRVKKELEKNNLEACILFDPVNVRYALDTVNMSIGQGDLLATPLQVATVAMLIANRGRWVRPRMILSSDSQLFGADPPEKIANISGLEEKDWTRIIQSMEAVVHRGNKGFRQNGTAWNYIGQNISYRMAGKSGTAQVVEIKQGEEYDEESLDERKRKHAWFMAFAPVDEPEIAVAVLVENGGGGSAIAAPIAREVIDAYLIPQLASNP